MMRCVKAGGGRGLQRDAKEEGVWQRSVRKDMQRRHEKRECVGPL